ncbi:heme peroxidase [Hortaea werneckii]|nr:heme peroxidase [Hortaea werneckii]
MPAPQTNGELPNGDQRTEGLSTLDEFANRLFSWGYGNSGGASEDESDLSDQYTQLANKISGSVSQLKTILDAMRAPLPTQTGDGSQLAEEKSKESTFGLLKTVLGDLGELGPSRIGNLVEKILHGTLNTGCCFTASRQEHPPQTLLGDQYQYRQPDGSNNNYELPHIGKAGMPYARTVAPKTKMPGCLPDPGILFDTVMARKNPKGEEHPAKVSSMLFYLASIIIHDAFRTDHTDFNVSNTSSYLDLAPLYGSNWEEQKRMRTFKDGKIKPDCFSETRLLTFPPGVGALLIMFNRYHNWIVEQLAMINEGGRFTENPRQVEVDRYGEKINKRDDNLFQTGRLVTCGLYINIILVDYVRTILNLNCTDEDWQLDPRVEMDDGPPVGTGNQVSAEFNLVYRWHAAISTKDDKWSQDLFKEISPDMSAEEVAQPDKLKDFLAILAKKEAEFMAQDPTERPFPALKYERLERIKEGPYEGNFEDSDIAKILTEGIEDCANSFGPQQVPTVMKAIEVLGIRQARSWKLATLNEFRKHFLLEPHRTFADITTNVEVQEALKHLYGTPDNVELYPGLVVEDCKRPMMLLLLSAVTAFTPALTHQRISQISGSQRLPRICQLTMGVYFTSCSFELCHAVMIRLPFVFSYDAALNVMENKDLFHVTWGKAMEFLMGPEGRGFMLAGDGDANERSRKLMEKAIYLNGSSRSQPKGNEKWMVAVKEFYEHMTTSLLKEKSHKLGRTKHVDILRDVGNMVHVHFCAELFCLPLKTKDFPRGILTEQQLYMIMAAVFICIFFDVDPPKSFPLRIQAKDATQQLGQFVKLLVQAIKYGGDLAEWGIRQADPITPSLSQYGVHMISKLLEANPNVDDLVWGNIMGTAGGMVANQGQLFGQAMDFFMSSPEGQKHWPTVQQLARDDSDEAFDKLMHYFMEASRLNGETGVLRYLSRDMEESEAIVDKTGPLGEKRYVLKKGDKVMVCLKAASRDPAAFPNPDRINLNRSLDSYIHLGHGPHQCLGLPMTRVALTTMLKVIARLDNLQPVPVSIGGDSVKSSVKKVTKEFVPGDSKVLPEDQ